MIALFCIPVHAQQSIALVDEGAPVMQLSNELLPGENTQYDLLQTPLNAFKNPFQALSDFNFSFVRYARRGYENNLRTVSVNGIDLRDLFSSNLQWNPISAINNTPAQPYINENLTPGSYDMGLLSGVTEYAVGAGDLPKRARARVMFTDRRFRAGLQMSAATGWMENGWAVALAGSRRWGRDQYIRGVYSDNYSMYGSVARKLGKRNTLSLSYLRAPSDQGVRGAATAEVFDLTSDPLYNPYWGYQQERIRSSRVRTSDQPLTLLTWEITPNEQLKISTSIAHLGGERSYSSLDWYNAANPSPDYYRYLPSGESNPQVVAQLTQMWEARDPKVTQVNWEELYFVNRHSSPAPAAYVMSDAVDRTNNLQAVSTFNYTASPQITLRGGLRLQRDESARFSRLSDLLGGNYLLDVDPYLINDEYYGDQLQNDLRHPNREVVRGDHFNYNYTLKMNRYGLWSSLHWVGKGTVEGLSAYAALQAAQLDIHRIGHYEKELFPGNASYGQSKEIPLHEYMIKVGAGWNFSPSHGVALDLATGQMPPGADDLFLWPDYQNSTIRNPISTNLMSSEVRYRVTWGPCTFLLSGYLTLTRGESNIRHYYDDLVGEFSALALSGIEKQYVGTELGVNIDLTSRLSLNLAAALSNNSYLSNPEVKISTQKQGNTVVEDAHSYMKGYQIGGSPQQVASAELRYQGGHMWNASMSINYVGDNYLSMNPARRMRRVYDLIPTPEGQQDLLYQEHLPSATTLNLYIGKTFAIGTHYLSINGSINNLLGTSNILYSGYEPMRLKRIGTDANKTIAPSDSKYYYAYGRTFYLSLNFRF